MRVIHHLIVSENPSGFIGDGTIYNYSILAPPMHYKSYLKTQGVATETPGHPLIAKERQRANHRMQRSRRSGRF